MNSQMRFISVLEEMAILCGQMVFAGVVTGLLAWSGAHVLYALIILQRLG